MKENFPGKIEAMQAHNIDGYLFIKSRSHTNAGIIHFM